MPPDSHVERTQGITLRNRVRVELLFSSDNDANIGPNMLSFRCPLYSDCLPKRIASELVRVIFVMEKGVQFDFRNFNAFLGRNRISPDSFCQQERV